MAIELRNNKGKTFLGLTPDGRRRYSLDCSIGAIQFREMGQGWQDIDPSIEEEDTGDFTIKTSQTPYLGRIGNDSHRRIYPDRTNLNCWIEFDKPYPSMGTPTRSDRWFYWDFTNAKMGIRFDNTSVKFGFRLKNASAPTSITIPFATQGITRQGRFLYHSEDTLYEYPIAELRKPIATDATGEERDCEVIFGAGELTISLDTTGLTFPVDIDPTLDLDIASSANDADQNESSGVCDIDNTTIRQRSNAVIGNRYYGAHRWTGISIPEGADIDVAYVELYINSTLFDDIDGDWYFEKVASPAQFTTDTSNISSRAKTTEYVNWDEDSLGTGRTGSQVSLVTPLQEVIDSYSPTSLVLIFKPKTVAKSCDSRAYDYTGNTYGAELHIEYTAASNTILLQVGADLDDVHELESSGVVTDGGVVVSHISDTASVSRKWGAHRWTSGSLPSVGATIDKCYVQLHIWGVANDNANGNLHFEELAAPAQFVVEDDNVTIRDRTETSVSWIDELEPGWNDSPELKTALQEVIDTYSPTALVLIFRPNQDSDKILQATAHNSDNALAARIFIKWTPAAAITLELRSSTDTAARLSLDTLVGLTLRSSSATRAAIELTVTAVTTLELRSATDTDARLALDTEIGLALRSATDTTARLTIEVVPLLELRSSTDTRAALTLDTVIGLVLTSQTDTRASLILTLEMVLALRSITDTRAALALSALISLELRSSTSTRAAIALTVILATEIQCRSETATRGAIELNTLIALALLSRTATRAALLLVTVYRYQGITMVMQDRSLSMAIPSRTFDSWKVRQNG